MSNVEELKVRIINSVTEEDEKKFPVTDDDIYAFLLLCKALNVVDYMNEFIRRNPGLGYRGYIKHVIEYTDDIELEDDYDEDDEDDD